MLRTTNRKHQFTINGNRVPAEDRRRDERRLVLFQLRHGRADRLRMNGRAVYKNLVFQGIARPSHGRKQVLEDGVIGDLGYKSGYLIFGLDQESVLPW